jgi:hypothetical protein
MLPHIVVQKEETKQPISCSHVPTAGLQPEGSLSAITEKCQIHKCFIRKPLWETRDLGNVFNGLRRVDEKGLAASKTTSPLYGFVTTALR